MAFAVCLAAALHAQQCDEKQWTNVAFVRRERCLSDAECGGFQSSPNWKQWYPRLLRQGLFESDATCNQWLPLPSQWLTESALH